MGAIRCRSAYAHARLQARYGLRITVTSWRYLEATGDLASCLTQANLTPLGEWTSRLTPVMSSHAIEGGLREAWRKYVLGVARLVHETWRPAVACWTWLPDLPALQYLSGDEPPLPEWLLAEPRTREFTTVAREERLERVQRIFPVSSRFGSGTPDFSTRWSMSWRSLWPRVKGREARGLAALESLFSNHHQRMLEARRPEEGQQLREALGADLRRIFRAYAQSSAATFAFLGLVALDMERLRGLLIDRALFGYPSTVS